MYTFAAPVKACNTWLTPNVTIHLSHHLQVAYVYIKMLHDTSTNLYHVANIDKFYYVDYIINIIIIIILVLLLLLRCAAHVFVVQKHFCGQKLKNIHQIFEHAMCSAFILWCLQLSWRTFCMQQVTWSIGQLSLLMLVLLHIIFLQTYTSDIKC